MAGGVDTSLFRVGDNIALWQLLAMMSATVLFIVVLERLLHRLEHHLKRYPKYHEMMTKVYGELMILGFIGLAIKVLKEVTRVDFYASMMLAFQAADLTVFLIAIALILQAAVVFLRIRRKNVQVDKAELISSQHLVDLIARTQLPTWFHEFSAMFTYARTQDRRCITKADIPELAKLRMLRHYFLKTYGLPEAFPFSKYLRQAQDNQISHMIEVEISTWIMLLLIGWAMEGVAYAVTPMFEDDDDSDSEDQPHKGEEKYAVVVAYLIFSWAAVLLHSAICMYFTWAIDKLLDAAVDTHDEARPADRYTYLNEIADHEAQTAAEEGAADAIAVMERVRKAEGKRKVKRERSQLTQHDTGFQLVSSLFRKASSYSLKPQAVEKTGAAARDMEAPIVDLSPVQAGRREIHLPWFSRKAWHFLTMSSLMLNAFYMALFCQCIIFQMRPIYHKFGAGCMLFLPLSLLINITVLQPRILRNFILVSSIVRVDDTALGDVIDHFTQTVQLRAGFVEAVHTYLESTQQTLADLEAELVCRDTENNGLLEAEEVRLVLKRFGFKLSYFRFNSVAKLLFDLQGISIEYAQVIRLLELGRSDDMRSLAASTMKNSMTGSFPLSSGFVFPDSAGTPYTTDATPKPRSKKPLLRAKSSAASSLYRFDFEDATSSAAFASNVLASDASSPGGLQYLRM